MTYRSHTYETVQYHTLMDQNQFSFFENKAIRKTPLDSERWFSVVDVVALLTDSLDAGAYWRRLKKRLEREGSEVVASCRRLKLKALGGGMRETDCANTEGILRIIQSVSSPKAEPIKRWIAAGGYERMREIENPELASDRTRRLYESKGYPEDWIERRMRGIAIREELTDEWKKRGAHEQQDYELLTNEMSKATFGVTPAEYRQLKGLERENLRDHMDDFELIFSMLGERATIEIHRVEKSEGVEKLKNDATVGGDIANGAMKRLENRLGRPIVSDRNFKQAKRSQE